MECNDIIEKFPPNLICSNLFVPPYLKKHNNLHKVGLYSFKKQNTTRFSAQKGLLISCGYGGLLKDQFLRFVTKIEKPENIAKIWIEPSLYNDKMPKYVLPATYDSNMYNQISAAIIRPGIGTITDCLQHAIKIFSLTEQGNAEIEFNSKVLKKNNLGCNIVSLSTAFEEVNKFLFSKKKQYLFEKSLKVLDFDGANQTVKIILSKKT